MNHSLSVQSVALRFASCLIVLATFCNCGVELNNRTAEYIQRSVNNTYKVSLEINPTNVVVDKAYVIVGQSTFSLKPEGDGLWSYQLISADSSFSYSFRVHYRFPNIIHLFTDQGMAYLPSSGSAPFVANIVQNPSSVTATIAGGANPSSLPIIRAAGNADGRINVVWYTTRGGGDHRAYFRSALMADSAFGPTIELGPAVAAWPNGGFDGSADGTNIFVSIPHWPPGDESEIYLASSTDSGASFQSPINVSESNQIRSSKGRVASEGNRVCVAWIDNNASGSHDIRYRESRDQGRTFDSLMSLATNVADEPPAIACVGNNVYVLYCGTDRITSLMRGSILTGTFDPPQRLTTSGASSVSGAERLAVSGNTICALWSEGDPASQTIRIAKSVDGTSFFPFPSSASAGTVSDMSSFNLAVEEGDIYISWIAGSVVRFVRYRGSSNYPSIQLSQGTSESPQTLRLVADGGHIHVVWQQGTRIVYRHSCDGGHNFDSEITIADGGLSAAVLFPDIQARGADRYIVWRQGNSILCSSWRLR